jgi:hypothetical protein
MALFLRLLNEGDAIIVNNKSLQDKNYFSKLLKKKLIV